MRSPLLLAALADAAVPGIRPIKVEGLPVPAGDLYQSAHITGADGRVWLVRSALTGAAGAELAASDALVQLLTRRVDFDVPRVEGVQVELQNLLFSADDGSDDGEWPPTEPRRRR